MEFFSRLQKTHLTFIKKVDSVLRCKNAGDEHDSSRQHERENQDEGRHALGP
jgi:hypothetical protein